MNNIIRTKNFYLILFVDILFILTAYLSAYFLRFEGNLSAFEWEKIWATIPYIVILKVLFFGFFGLYKGMWRYTGLVDLSNVLRATLISSAVIFAFILFIYRFEGFSRSVFALDWVLTFILIGGARVAIRLILFEKDRGFRFFCRFLPGQTRSPELAKRLLIIGADDAAEKMLREIRDNPGLNYKVIGLLDDDPGKKGMHIHGVAVLGSISQARKMAACGAVDEILIAMPSASAENMRRIIDLCEATHLKFRTIPAIGELINGKVSFNAIREVSYEDILGREPVSLELTRIGEYLRNGVVLVSGAGGSIGSELCRQITKFSPKNLILLDKTENSLFRLEMEFRQNFPETSITPILGDVQQQEFLTQLFFLHRPGVVFHAAAYKHVPIVELNPWQGVLNNIIGTKNLIETALRFQTSRFIMVSTDKAVRPSSVMGATKRVAEMITASYAASNSVRFSSVRFGNVIGSEGNVIDLFRKQIKRLGPVTVTHPEMTRYFMTISEASKLILQAGALGTGGEIFILNMGTPIKILDMARDLIRLSGFKPDTDIEIKFIGLRPGEKLYEELITEGEGIVPTSHDKILVLRGNHYDPAWLKENIQELQQLALAQNAPGIKAKLREMIPEYQPFDMKSQKSLSPVYPAAISFAKPPAGSNGSQWKDAAITVPGIIPPHGDFLPLHIPAISFAKSPAGSNGSQWKGAAGTAPGIIPPHNGGVRIAEPKRIYLSSPHLDGRERTLMLEAFESNWITTLGPQVDAFEKEICEKIGVRHAAALGSGTAGLHLALLLLGVGRGDEVFCSDLTFAATANAIVYCGATPIFIDSSRDTWNMDPALLGEELKARAAKKGKLPKAVVAVDLYGQCADYDPISEMCNHYGVPLIEDSAEALGSEYKGKSAGRFGVMGIFSFNGNKIITTSGGGMLVSDSEEYVRQARFLSTQARNPAPHYQHSQIGYNYRLSNLLAAVGRGQLERLEEKINRRRAINRFYRRALADLPGIEFMPEADYGKSNCWLTVILVSPEKFGADRERIRLALEAENIEARPAWKPMHLQPVFQDCRRCGGSVSEDLFQRGLCLPSGTQLSPEDLERVVQGIKKCFSSHRSEGFVPGRFHAANSIL